MNKLSEVFKNMSESWKKFSSSKKIAFSVIIISFLAGIIYLVVSLATPKYSILFSNLDTSDSGAIIAKLKSDKVDYQVKGDAIYVPANQVDDLRMTISSSVTLTNGSQGWELMDTSQFGVTDAQMKVNYQRALEGELEKTIKSFPQIQGSKVHLVIPDDTAFVQDATKATASVTLLLKAGQSINNDQVKAIVALVSGSVKNLPKENIDIVDDKLKLLTANLYSATDGTGDSSTEYQNQQLLVRAYEKQQEDKIMDLLQKSYKDKVSVKVNADMNFDAVQSDSTKYDPTGTVRSENKQTTGTGTGTGTGSGSPVDSNMVNSTTTTTTGTNSNSSSNITNNYEIGSTETKTVKAPGTLNRITASILVDGTLDSATKASINNIVQAAIGFNQQRGDSISIESMKFDTSAQDAAKQAVIDLQKETAKASAAELIKYVIIVAAVLIGFIIAVIILKRKTNKDEMPNEIQGMDVVVGDSIEPKPKIEYEPINFEVDDEKTHLESEIRKYATEKPEQVVDIVKSWLAEDER